MKWITFSLLFLFGCKIAMAQSEVPADTVLTMEEKLVQIAIENNPDIEILSNDKNIAMYGLRKSKWNWINQITLSGNLNEFTIDQNAGGDGVQPAFYPRYNISLTVPLGLLGTRSNEVKMSREEYKTTSVEIEKKETEIRKQVLTLYENYSLYQKLIKIQNQKTEDEYSYYKSIENKFSNQNADIEEFKNASNAYNLELERKYSIAYEQKIVKIALESLLGMPLEEAEKK